MTAMVAFFILTPFCRHFSGPTFRGLQLLFVVPPLACVSHARPRVGYSTLVNPDFGITISEIAVSAFCLQKT